MTSQQCFSCGKVVPLDTLNLCVSCGEGFCFHCDPVCRCSLEEATTKLEETTCEECGTYCAGACKRPVISYINLNSLEQDHWAAPVVESFKNKWSTLSLSFSCAVLCNALDMTVRLAAVNNLPQHLVVAMLSNFFGDWLGVFFIISARLRMAEIADKRKEQPTQVVKLLEKVLFVQMLQHQSNSILGLNKQPTKIRTLAH